MLKMLCVHHQDEALYTSLSSKIADAVTREKVYRIMKEILNAEQSLSGRDTVLHGIRQVLRLCGAHTDLIDAIVASVTSKTAHDL
jgi:hypothetical protein